MISSFGKLQVKICTIKNCTQISSDSFFNRFFRYTNYDLTKLKINHLKKGNVY